MATLNDLKIINGYPADTGSSDFITGTTDGDFITIHSGADLVEASDGNDYIFDATGLNGQGYPVPDRTT